MEIDGYREPGARLWFEYHCLESPGSADAELWYKSHSRVTVIECMNMEYSDLDQTERQEGGTPLVYTVQFEDGHIGDVFEDELLDTKAEYYRPDPPKHLT